MLAWLGPPQGTPAPRAHSALLRLPCLRRPLVQPSELAACHTTAAAKNRTIPTPMRPRPGQFAFKPNPRPGRRGSSVSPLPSEAEGVLLSRPFNIGGTAVSKTPAITQSVAIQISAMLELPDC
jgi:hypothetical protein